MKKIFFILLILISIIGSFFYATIWRENSLCLNLHKSCEDTQQFETWCTLESDDNISDAQFPSLPKLGTRTLPVPGDDPDLPYTEYCCETGQVEYSISYTTLPKKWLRWGNSLVLKGALKFLLKEVGKVKLIGKSSNTFKGFSALDYEYYLENTECAGTLVLVKDRLYKVEVSYPLKKRGEMECNLSHFIEHFTPSQS